MTAESGFSPGDWNAQCDLCGRQFRASLLRKNWKGQYVCAYDWEERHPQDFVRPVPDKQVPPWIRLNQQVYLQFCSPNGITAIPGFAIPGCMMPGFIHPLFDPTA